jgi:hypothetical protein
MCVIKQFSFTLTVTHLILIRPMPWDNVPLIVKSHTPPRTVVTADERSQGFSFDGFSLYFGQPMSNCLNTANCESPSGFVNISATYLEDSRYVIDIVPSFTCLRKWWYFRAICSLRGLIRGALTRSMQPWLSSCILQCTTGVAGSNGIECYNSRKWPTRGSISRRDCDNAMYSASVVDKAISLCNLLDHITGHLAYLMI